MIMKSIKAARTENNPATNTDAHIPFVVGVTGHRDLRDEDIPALERLVREQLVRWMELCPHTEFFCMTSLAEGADQLVGRVASELGMKLLVPLPMEQTEYEKDFSESARDEFRSLLRQADAVYVAPDTEGLDDNTREYGYRKAGIYLARHCHVLLALWDGQAGEGGCCGTAEAVDFKLKRAYRAPDTLLSAPDEGIVLHVVTPRMSGAEIPERALTIRLIQNADGALDALLTGTERFNADASEETPISTDAVFDRETMAALGPDAVRLQSIYHRADTLALRYRDRYVAVLKWLCIAGALLVAAFLLYDELEANLFLIVYGSIALFALILFVSAKRSRCHQRYIEYRLFAETLRVQLNLMASGLHVDAEDLMPWSQRTISPWIREAMNTLPRSGKPVCGACADVREVWIREQLNYQKNTLKKNRAKLKKQSAIAGALLALTILFSAVVVMLEFFVPEWIGGAVSLPDWFLRATLAHSADFFSTRGVFKILLGLIPAFTFVVSSYYGKLSLERKIRDGQRMIALYAEALEAYDNPLTDRARLLIELAREELVEAGDWLSYTFENRPDLLI